MSGYEVEHNLPTTQKQQTSRRPDMSTLYATLELVDTSNQQEHTNVHAQPLPENVEAAYRLAATGYDMMRDGSGAAAHEQTNELLSQLVEELMRNANDPPTEVQGVPDSFLDKLERVPNKTLKSGDICPICGNPFLEDEYPLVVELPCHKDHRFDLECIRPWLKLNSTCPLDRKELLKKKAPPPPPVDDEDGEYDDFYA